MQHNTKFSPNIQILSSASHSKDPLPTTAMIFTININYFTKKRLKPLLYTKQ